MVTNMSINERVLKKLKEKLANIDEENKLLQKKIDDQDDQIKSFVEQYVEFDRIYKFLVNQKKNGRGHFKDFEKLKMERSQYMQKINQLPYWLLNDLKLEYNEMQFNNQRLGIIYFYVKTL